MEKDLINICLHYGVRKQIKKLAVEVFELQESVIERNNGNTYTDYFITEDLADVMVIWEQIRLYYKISADDVRMIMRKKIDRQLKRIEDEKKQIFNKK